MKEKTKFELTCENLSTTASGKLVLTSKRCEKKKECNQKRILLRIALIMMTLFSVVLIVLTAYASCSFSFDILSHHFHKDSNNLLIIIPICCVTLLVMVFFIVATIIALQKREAESERKSMEYILKKYDYLERSNREEQNTNNENLNQNVDNSLTINIKGNITIDRKNDGDNE